MSIWQTFRFFSSSPRIFVTSVPLSLRLFASKSQFCFGFVATMFWFIPLFSFLFWAKTSTKPFGKDGSDSIWQIAAALAMTGSTKSSAIGQFAKILLDWRWPQASSNGLIRALYDPFSFRFVSLNSAPAEYTRRREIEEKKLYDKIGNTQPSDSFVFAVISNKLSPHMKESCAVCTHQTTLISFSFVVVSLRRISSVCLSFFCLCWLIFVGFWTNRQDRIKLDYVFIFHLVCSLFFHSCIQFRHIAFDARTRDNLDATHWLCGEENLVPVFWNGQKTSKMKICTTSVELCKSKQKIGNFIPMRSG